MSTSLPRRDWQPLPTLLLAVIVVVIAAVGAAWWWAGTQASLLYALDRLSRAQPVTFEQAQGSLRSGIHVGRVVWLRNGLTVEARDVDLAWRPLFLLGGTLKLEHVNAAGVRVTDQRPPSAPAAPPESLAIGAEVDIEALNVGHLEWTGARAFEADRLSAHYWYDGKAHSLKLDSVVWQGRAYQGNVTVGAAAPLPVEATLTGTFAAPLPKGQSLPLRFAATVRGPIADLRADLQLHGVDASSATAQATATARIAPWAVQPVASAHASFTGLDASVLAAGAPHTQLAGQLHVVPAGTSTWQVQVDVTNAEPGPWDEGRLPVGRVQALGQWRDGMALVQQMEAAAGGGTVHASGQWDGPEGWTMKGTVQGVDPAALHTKFAAAPLGGRIDATQRDKTIAFDLDLQGGRAARAAPALKGQPAAQKMQLQRLTAKGTWDGERITLPHLAARTDDASLIASGVVNPGARSGEGHVGLDAPGLHLLADGSVSQTQGRGALAAQAQDVALARAWLQRLPLPLHAEMIPDAGGRANFSVAWQGGWSDPALQVRLSAPLLQMHPGTREAGAAAPWTITDARGTWNGRLADAEVALRANANQGQRRASFDFTGKGGRDARTSQWHAHIATFTASAFDPAIGPGAWELLLRKPVDARWDGSLLDVGAGQARLTAPARTGAAAPPPASLEWDAVQWRPGDLRTRGKLTGLTMAWLELAGGSQLAGSAFTGDMVFDAQWDAQLGRTLKLDASVARASGDVNVLAETTPGVSSRVPAGVRDARLTLTGSGDDIALSLRWESERAGTAEGRITSKLAAGGALGRQWAADAPLAGNLRAHLPRIGVWSLLAPPGWRLRGSLETDVRIAGTRAGPELSGTLAAEDLALRSVVDGVEMQGGRLRAHFEGNRLVVSEFTLHGAGDNGGTLAATGEAAWVQGAPQLQAQAQLTRLRAAIRSDRQLTISGHVDAHVDAAVSQLRGQLKVDQARFVLPDEETPKLGDDVVVRNDAAAVAQPSNPATAPVPTDAKGRAVDVGVDLDLGSDFALEGRGLRTRLSGTLAITAKSLSQPQVVGTIVTSGGQYQAYGQRLNVERGLMRFTGRYDNPALDILAIRPNLTQRVGVLINGSARAPFVALYAEPDLPEAEKLAWLVTGRAAPATGAESALVQQAALALLASRHPGAAGLASRVGLDELSVRRDSTAGAIVTVGKRFADNFYASYERSLSGALGTLYVFYDVSRRLTVRAQAGEQSGVDLIYTLRFD